MTEFNTTPTPTVYQSLRDWRYWRAYLRGKFKGDAPAEDRRKNYFRVVERNPGDSGDSGASDASSVPTMAVRFHFTDILTAYPDGTVRLNLGGYDASQATLAAVNHVGLRFTPARTVRLSICRARKFSISTTVVGTIRGWARYHDGMLLRPVTDPAYAGWELLTDPVPFKARRLDPVQVADLNASLQESGFKAMFPLLYDAQTLEDMDNLYFNDLWSALRDRYPMDPDRPLAALQDSNSADLWGDIVAMHKFFKPNWHAKPEARTRSQTWTNLMAARKERMYHNVDTDTLFI